MSLNKRKKSLLISTISGNPRSIFEDLQLAELNGIGGIHFDVMDGIFVPRLGLYPELLSEIKASTNLKIEVHRMLDSAVPYIERFVDAGADHFLFHLESKDNLNLLLDKVYQTSASVGLVLNPQTDISYVAPYIENIKSITLMAINPGVPRHPMIESTFDKLTKLRNLVDSAAIQDVTISIDGGVTFQNCDRLFELGADSLVCGSGTIFNRENEIIANLHKLKMILAKYNAN